MIKEDNNLENLKRLYFEGKITLQQFFFRKGAEDLNINTYKLK